MITPENIVRHELIGLEAKIIDSRNKKNIGISGKVIDETRNTLVIEKPNGRIVKLIKEENIFLFKIDKLWVKVEGKLLVARPEDRIKKKFKKW
ncbi:MAG: ribonuclease P protein component 1 [Candidatus Aenigmarchaeota archaeon]|nr:ribonuclease P protein component 1 [Candidatus Aenigmarchaeota archaeon]